MNTAVAILVGLVSIAVLVFNVWLFVVGVQFLRVGTRAFRRYLAVNPAAPVRGQQTETVQLPGAERGYR